MKLPIEKITLDPELQPRNELNADAIQQYSTDMKAGDTFPPVEAIDINGRYYLTSGWHRVLAAKRAGLEIIDAIVTTGSRDDALWMACASNVEHDKSGSRRTNADKRKAVKMALKVKREAIENNQISHNEIARHTNVSRQTINKWWERLYCEKENNRLKEPIVNNDTSQKQDKIDLEIEEIQDEIGTENNARLNKVNENIEWAAWSWNPVTGCLHDCEYCYARDIANRFYPEGFQPSFHPDRLEAPDNTNVPINPRFYGDVGYKNIFTCSMADLFGKWVPVEWIHSVLESINRNQQWTFLLLTKFPIRMAEFEYPPNVWLGTSVDYQHAVQRAETAFVKIKESGFQGICWLSCEPMMEKLTFNSLDMFDWIVMGGSSISTKTPEFKPPFDWIVHLYNQARKSDCLIYQKTNLIPGMSNGQRIREYPTI